MKNMEIVSYSARIRLQEAPNLNKQKLIGRHN